MDPHLRRLRLRCRCLAGTVPLPDPFTPKGFASSLAGMRGRPVELVPVPASTSCGLLVSTPTADYIGYPTDTTALHQRHIMLHEAAHLLCGHAGGLDPSVSTVLLPHLSPALVRRVLGRSAYTDPQEQEAELLASLLAQRVARPSAAVAPDRLDPLFGRG
jgi:hypothetical protein